MVTTAQTIRQAHEAAKSSYFGGRFDRLSPASQVMTAIAWDNYPDKSFDEFVAAVREFSSESADVISDRGIDFEIIARGESYKASGFSNPASIACDTEEWDCEIPSGDRIWREDDDLNEQIRDAIGAFGISVCNEVEEYLQAHYELTPAELVERLSVRVKVIQGVVKGNAWYGEDSTEQTFRTLAEAQQYICDQIDYDFADSTVYDQTAVNEAREKAFSLQIGERVTISEIYNSQSYARHDFDVLDVEVE